MAWTGSRSSSSSSSRIAEQEPSTIRSSSRAWGVPAAEPKLKQTLQLRQPRGEFAVAHAEPPVTRHFLLPLQLPLAGAIELVGQLGAHEDRAGEALHDRHGEHTGNQRSVEDKPCSHQLLSIRCRARVDGGVLPQVL